MFESPIQIYVLSRDDRNLREPKSLKNINQKHDEIKSYTFIVTHTWFYQDTQEGWGLNSSTHQLGHVTSTDKIIWPRRDVWTHGYVIFEPQSGEKAHGGLQQA